VKQLNVTDQTQVLASRTSSNVEYWGYDPSESNRALLVLNGPLGSDDFDANLTASGVEHLSLPWYVRGGTAANMDSLVNLTRDIANA